ncbi:MULTISPECIES: hypothetical protein [unclassified Methylobacterium]|uniref:hypothetical protein n=1 Tax=unclassified Methylobacterium TaxID=2615210 RepID=UPI001FB8A53A|nr:MULTISPECIES: hypothetical protein [unclassified Methylobacterium]MCJ2022266.1 hypothetical protein [Methylobacterium sp. E-065]
MTDAAGFDPMTATSSADERVRLLGQIAEALKIPVSTFQGRGTANAGPRGPAASECAALLAAFSRIEDPDQRRECLAIVERFSER